MAKRNVSSQGKIHPRDSLVRHFDGRWLYLARVGYVITLLIVLGLFVLGTPEYARYLNEGKIGVVIDKNERGEIILLPIPRLDAEQAGVRNEDVLLAVNGVPIPPEASIEEVIDLLKGKKGESVTITVRTGNEAPRDYKIIRSQSYLKASEQLHIPYGILNAVQVILNVFSLLGFGIISLLIFVRRSDDWLAFLVALALITFAAILQNVSFGAKVVGLTVVYYFLDSIGSFLPVFLLCIFPNGHFVPAWTGRFSRLLFLWAIASFFLLAFPASWWPENLTYWIWMLFFSVGVYAQVYRYLYVSNPVERQQFKWIVVGFPFALFSAIALVLTPELFLIHDVFQSISTLSNLFVAVCLGFAVFRYKLWDTDFYINRAWIYGTVTGALAALWWLGVILLQALFDRLTVQESPSSPLMAALLSGVQVAAIFRPVRDWIQNWINIRFYKDRIDFTKAIVELQSENWQFISVKDLYHTMTESVAKLLESNISAVYIHDGRAARLADVRGIAPAHAHRFKLNEKMITDLQKGKVVQFNQENPFSLLVPLIVPRHRMKDLIGVLALGPRGNGAGYSRDHMNDLKNLGERAGVAIHFLQLHEKKNASN